jgi:nitrite reductase/ring-hydroxylating ferredoxin subunit
MKNIVIILLVTLIFALGCKKDEHPVPNNRFTAYIDLRLPEYNTNVFTVGYDRFGSRVGVAGVIVYRVALDEYYVFERYCPHDQELKCAVDIADGNTTAICPCCESEFLIAAQDGDVIDGPSDYSLKTYRTRMDGSFLVIYN